MTHDEAVASLKYDEQAQRILVLTDQGIEIRNRLETKAQDLLKEIYRL